MTTAAGIVFTGIIVAFIAAVIVYRRHRVGSFKRAIAALGGRPTRPGPLPPALDWAGTEIVAARAIEIVPGVPATFVALTRSASPAASDDFGTTRADPFLMLRLPAEAVPDAERFQATLAATVALDAIDQDATGHLVASVRALHTGPAVRALIDATRAALSAAAAPAGQG